MDSSQKKCWVFTGKDLNEGQFDGFVSVEGDCKTRIKYEKTPEGTIKVQTRRKFQKVVSRRSRKMLDLKNRLRSNGAQDSKESGTTNEECFIELPKNSRKFHDDFDDISAPDKNIFGGGVSLFRKDGIKDKFMILKSLESGRDMMPYMENVEPKEGVEEENRVTMKGRSKDEFTIRVTNLPDDMEENNLEELFRECGKIYRIYLARDKETRVSKGFAFITYDDRKSGEKAIKKWDRHGYESLVLKVEWAKPVRAREF